MSVSLPNLSTNNYLRLTGTTTQIGANGMSTDYNKFVVSKSGQYDFKLSNTFTNFQIVDQNNKVVAQATSTSDPSGSASARLGPGTYTAIVSQTRRGVSQREYEVDVSEKQNVMLLSSGGTLKGTAFDSSSSSPGIQKHTLNVVQGGEFVANLSMKNARWALMDKDGKVVGSGDTMSDASNTSDFLKRPSFKIDPGQYSLVVVPPTDVGGKQDYSLGFIPKVAQAPADTTVDPIQKTLQERSARLQQWAAEDSSGKNPASGPFKMTVLS